MSEMTKSETGFDPGNPERLIDEPFIDKAEVCRRLHMRARTVDTWMKNGRLVYYKMGKLVRFKWSEIEAHLAKTCRVVNEE